MIYSRVEREVTVKFTVEEFGELLGILGAALVLTENEPEVHTTIGQFIEDLNRTNPDFTLYILEGAMKHGDKTTS